MSLYVLDAGLAARVVDMGRPNSRSLGVPVGGAADRAALALGNALVGNPPQAPGLEICLKGPVLRGDNWLEGVLFGAPFSMASARRPLRAGTTFTLEPGEEIHIGTTQQGMRAYLCVRGGLEAPVILGSRSALEPIQAGETLSCPSSLVSRPSSLVPPRFFPPQVAATLADHRWQLRVVPGLQADWFTGNSFYDQEFQVTPALDRMGLRLAGRTLPFPERELVSEPVCPGAVQITRDGQSIVLGVDGQTIGGYPKIAQVIQADLDHLGQLRPGDRLRFERVELAEAASLFRERQAFLQEWLTRARCRLDGS
jgi:biotin-dependent carboxylase-like uncharacterized protein